MKKINLSYVISTRNKLPYLKYTLPKLIENKKEDEEIVIADGNSTDGSKEYLQKLFEDGSIEKFISEKDQGEAHGFNKCFFMATGELIKIITDDDVFCFSEIEKAKQFMLENENIDVLGVEGAKINPSQKNEISILKYEKLFDNWIKNKTPFSFCGLSLMLRRRSLALTGLFDTSFLRVDAEFSLRITSGKSIIAWYTGCCYVHVANPDSNTITQAEKYYDDTKKLELIYPSEKKSYLLQKIKISIKSIIKTKTPNNNLMKNSIPYHDVFNKCNKWLKEINNKNNNFLYKKIK